VDLGDDAVSVTADDVVEDDGVAPVDPPDAVPAEGWGWHLRQLITWLLAVMLLVQVFGTWVFRDPGDYGVALYVVRWQHTGWRFFDAAFVAFAFVHGGLGLDHVVADRARTDTARLISAVVIGVVLLSVGLLAVSTILTFNLTA
jgi:succinate dehydrogenase hydrophobic anchor subunit